MAHVVAGYTRDNYLMTNAAKSIDWLRVTFEYGREDVEGYLPTTKGGALKERKALRPYHEARENGYFSLHWSDENPEWRVLFQMTGTQLAAFRKDGLSISDLFVWANRENGRFTRIDFAVDLFDTGGCPHDIRHCYHTSQVSTTAKSIFVVEKTGRKKSHGATVYVGSRHSERLLRVYDKGKQAKTSLDWIRVEMEVKGKRAIQFGELIVEVGVCDAGLSYIADIVEWSDIPWFEKIWSEDYVNIPLESIGRPETDRERWIRTVVVPVLEQELDSGADWLRKVLYEILESTSQSEGHAPSIIPYPE